ncbi:hypothetical protein ACYX8G_19525 [Microbacterium saperdae]
MRRTGQPLIIPALGTQRRIQALMTLGWSMTAIAGQFGDRRGNVRRILETTTISRRFATKIADAYDELSMKIPYGTDRHSRSMIARTRAYAARRRWLPPLAWDDIDTDTEPAATERSSDVDEVAVRLATEGHLVRLTPAERRACVEILHAKSYSDALIAETIHCTSKTVERIRDELNLPAHDPEEIITRRAA